MFKNKKEKICKNCKLFDANNSVCSIIILHESEKIKIPVDPKDSCFFEEDYFDPITNKKSNLIEDVKEVKLWVENEKGEKTNGNGSVKIEYPIGFFNEKSNSLF